MSPSGIRHVDLRKAPSLQPLSLAAELGRRADLLQDVPLDLLEALLSLVQGEALCFQVSSEEDLILLWRRPDAGFREQLAQDWLKKLNQVRQADIPSVDLVETPAPAARLSVPLPGSSLICGCICPQQQAEAQTQQLALFQAACGFVLSGLRQQQLLKQGTMLRHSAAWVELCSRLLNLSDFEELSLRLAEGLQQHLHLQGCMVARVSAQGRIRLEAMTGQTQIDRRGRLAELLEALFDYHQESDEVLHLHPEQSNHSPPFHEVGKQLHVEHASLIPLSSGQSKQHFFLLCLGQCSEESFLQALQAPLSVLLHTGYQRRSRGLAKWLPRVIGPAKLWKSLAVSAACALAAFFLLQPVPSRLRVQGQVEPELRRLITVQAGGLLAESPVRPGESLQEGQLLARLEDRELRLQEAELIAARERRRKRRDALAGSPEADIAEYQMASLELEETKRQLERLHLRQQQLRLESPISGILLSGDLSRRIGDRVEPGEILFEVAPLDQMHLELKVPSREIAGIEIGQQVRFRLEAFPEQVWEAEIRHIHARSQSSLPENPFLIVVPFPEQQELALRPGMQARASIEGEKAPRILQLLSPWVDRIRLLFF